MKEFDIAFPAGKSPDMEAIREAAARTMGTVTRNIGEIKFLRRSLDARKEIVYRYRCAAYLKDEKPHEDFAVPEYKDVRDAEPVLVIGSGPAG
ncbi:MAG: hypothetical protein IAB81_07425, partial [Bacteroidetes bacterium]|nr:hypothetical protein [Candidatus Merdivivens pullicola]